MSDKHKEADARMAERSREYMAKAIWSHLNLLLPRELSGTDIDEMTEKFIAAGLDTLNKRSEPSQ